MNIQVTVMSRKKKWVWWITIAALVIGIGIVGMRVVWMHYGKPEMPDRTNYKTLAERAKKGLAFAKRHNMNERYALFVDYSVPSGTPRLYVWDFKSNKVIKSIHTMHGVGGGSTAEHPRFSNKLGSECSTLGRFLVTKEQGLRLRRSFRIKGMDTDNQTAYGRGLMIHAAKWVDRWSKKKYIPLNRECCKGCVTVSSSGMSYLYALIIKEQKPLLLWNYESK